MRTDFNIQWERYKAWRRRCPLDDAELERRVRLTQENGKWKEENGKNSIRLWAPAAAAACLLLLLLPKMGASRQEIDIDQVDVGGRHFYFACNHGCSPDETINYISRHSCIR